MKQYRKPEIHNSESQVTLGITTLLTYVPVSLGAAHQAGALTLFTVVLGLLHSLRRPTTALPTVSKVGGVVLGYIWQLLMCDGAAASHSQARNVFGEAPVRRRSWATDNGVLLLPGIDEYTACCSSFAT